MSERGTVTAVPEGVQLQFRRSWPGPIEDVWAALTEPERTARWIGGYEGERSVGGTGVLTMTHEAEPAAEPMRIVECAPPRRLVVEWQNELGWRVELDLGREGEHTVLVFTQLFPPATAATDYALGWHWYLDKLAAEIGRQEPPGDWDTFLAATAPDYRPPGA